MGLSFHQPIKRLLLARNLAMYKLQFQEVFRTIKGKENKKTLKSQLPVNLVITLITDVIIVIVIITDSYLKINLIIVNII